MDRKEVVGYFLEKGILIDSDVISVIPDSLDFPFLSYLEKNLDNNKYLDKNNFCFYLDMFDKRSEDIIETNVEVVYSYKDSLKKREVQDFVKYFKNRYETIKGFLMNRSELQGVISINRLKDKKEGEKVSLIGAVMDKEFTKNGNCILKLEDTTGITSVLIGKNKEDLKEAIDEIVYDEIIGINGAYGKDIVFCNDIIFPDVPLSKELKKCEDDIYVAFISDVHYGLKEFLENEFINFVDWLDGTYGDDSQKKLSKKVGYLFIVGDLVEGVGIYPGQENDLVVKDIKEQYKGICKLLSKIPNHIKIIICGGNHDAMRIAEPQPLFDKDLSSALYELKNVTLVTNPSIVNIHKKGNFSGFDVLLYHGYSFIHYAETINNIRLKGGQERSDLIMKLLLKKRHLAPTHASTLYLPDICADPLIINKVPDIFASGHIHRVMVGSYRNVTLVNCSCWATQTTDMAKRGIVPHPAKVPLINLKTREIKVMNFLPKEKEIQNAS